jgi:hypothetical protein
VEKASWVQPIRLARLLGAELETARIRWDGRGEPPQEGPATGWVALVDQDDRFLELAELKPVATGGADRSETPMAAGRSGG